MRRIGLIATAALLAASPALAQEAGELQWPNLPEGVALHETPIVGPDGEEIGLLVLRGGENGVVGRFTIDAGVLEEGWHGAHFHSVGDCSDAPAFQASGGHITSEGAMHGYLNPEGPEAGDLANFRAGADGAAAAEFATSLVTMEGETPLLDEDGSAFVIHANADDHHTQPIGGAGDRMACAVIERE